jgi:hypothetical protein
MALNHWQRQAAVRKLGEWRGWLRVREFSLSVIAANTIEATAKIHSLMASSASHEARDGGIIRQ